MQVELRFPRDHVDTMVPRAFLDLPDHLALAIYLTLRSYGIVKSAGQAPETYATETAKITEPNVGLKVTIVNKV